MSQIINNPNGAYGYTDLATKGWQLQGNFKASAAITGPAVVAIGTEGKVATAATDSTAHLSIGIAPFTCASGDTIPVILMGLAENVPIDGAAAAGVLVKRSVTTAGSVAATATPAAGEVIGFAIAASSSNTSDVWVMPAKVTS